MGYQLYLLIALVFKVSFSQNCRNKYKQKTSSGLFVLNWAKKGVKGLYMAIWFAEQTTRKPQQK